MRAYLNDRQVLVIEFVDDLPFELVFVILFAILQCDSVPYLYLWSTSQKESTFIYKFDQNLQTWSLLLGDVHRYRIMDKLCELKFEVLASAIS